MVKTPLCRLTALFPLGESVNPNGSCVILVSLPAGFTILPLGKIEIPSGLIAVNSCLPGISIKDWLFKVVGKLKRTIKVNKQIKIILFNLSSAIIKDILRLI
jgi:hypothetical protein